jgi:cytochrome c-type protein NapC
MAKSGTSAKKTIIVVVLLFLAGIVFAGVFNFGVAYTNEMEFCTSCHSMQINLEEYKETKHYMNRSGVQATCSDCHVPRPWIHKIVRKIQASNELWHKALGTIDTPEKFEARRWEMANRVWDTMRATDSRECRNCHDFDSMDLSEQDRSARKKHAKAPLEGKTCIDCHQGIAHEYPDRPDDASVTEAASQ